MKNILLTITILFCSIQIISAQQGTIKGTVKDNLSGSPLINVNVTLNEFASGTTTDKDGNYNLNVSSGYYHVTFSYVGYKTVTATVEVVPAKETILNISLLPSSVAIGDVTVSSTRYITMEKDIALPMEVIDKTLIDKKAVNTLSDLLKNEPGLSISRDGIWSTSVVIRGLSKSSIVSMIDGNRIETATDLSAGLAMIDLSDIERVEVIKGGVSSLYGTSALGGAVNIITKRKTYGSKFFLSGTTSGDYNSVNEGSSGRLSLTTGTDKLYLRVSASKRNTENINTPRGELKNSMYNDQSISLSGGIKLIPNHELILDYQNYKATDVGVPGGSVFPTNASVKYPSHKRDMFSAEYNITSLAAFLPKVSLKYFNQNIYREVENIPNQVVVDSVNRRKTSVLSILPYGRHFTNGAQLQTDWLLSKSNLLIAGVDVWQRNLDSRRQRNIKVETFDSTWTNITTTTNRTFGEAPLPEAKYRSIGTFAQLESNLFDDKLSVTIGGRYDQINIKSNDVFNPVYIITNGVRNDNPADSLIYAATDENNNSWGGNIGLLYSVDDNIDLSFTAAHSFRSPSPEERFQFIDQGSIVRFGNPRLEPETGNFFDLGFRVWEDNFSFKGSVFLNLMKNLVTDVPGFYESRRSTYKSNIGEARLYGFDFATEFTISNYALTYISASYVRGEDTGNETDLPQVPPLNGRIGVRSDYLKYVTIDLTANIFDRQDKTASGEINTPGYVYYDMYLSSLPISFSYAEFQLFAGIENIFDKAYRNHLATNRGLVNIEPGRNIFVKAKLSW
ncbi:MAG: TonB-dependent receptor [Ignavibacteriales bacterium]|nr:MAG: TonB-dependent receptor [Ignavibacteriales bacterium]